MKDQDGEKAEFLRVHEFAARLGVNHKLVRRLIAKGEVFARRLGRAIRIPMSELERLKSPEEINK